MIRDGIRMRMPGCTGRGAGRENIAAIREAHSGRHGVGRPCETGAKKAAMLSGRPSSGR